MNTTQLTEMKQRARATWAAGDFPAVARQELWEVGDRVVRRLEIRPGEDVIDVACGTGNAAIRAAQAGATVTGVDITPELFDAGRAEAAAAGVVIDWVEGDAEDLQFPDASFDVVVSTFGCMFAPRHAIAASEMVRVLRPGGRLAITAWQPTGAAGEMFRVMGSYLPPPPDFVQPPALWGDPDHVRELFDGTGVTLEFETESLPSPLDHYGSAEEMITWSSENFGPMMGARALTSAQGRWDELRGRMIELAAQREPSNYLLTLGRKG